MNLNRRDFHRLTMAALGGAVTGTLAGCGGEQPAPATSSGTAGAASTGETTVVAANGEGHLCRGLNACKGQGADGKNDCAGQGTCASKDWRHSCGTQNKCKGQGGCGEEPGLNSCKGEGGCSVPLMDHAWKKVRERFEEKMKKDDKKFGEAPPEKKET